VAGILHSFRSQWPELGIMGVEREGKYELAVERLIFRSKDLAR
jgi:hypothetical protein